MIYKFKSKAAGDVIMMGPNGDEVMRLIGKEPAPKGIIEVTSMTSATAALTQAVDAEEDARKQAADAASADGLKLPPRDGIGLRQRVWPLVEMMKRSQAAGEPIVWGA